MVEFILKQIRLRILFIGAIGAIIFFFTQNCSRVNFQVPKEDSKAISTNLTYDAPEVFELAASGVSDAPDESGEFLLSGSVGGPTAMSPSTPSNGDFTLFTGFPSINTSF